MSDTIFIIVSGAGTGMGRMIRGVTRYPYSHVSVSFDPGLSVMYSFARRRRLEPFVGGFVAEYPSRYLCEGSVPVNVYALRLSDAEYGRVKNTVGRMLINKDKYLYNLNDAVSARLGVNCRIPWAYTCIGFASRLLRLDKIKSIEQLEASLSEYLIYTGTFDGIADASAVEPKESEEYFSKIPRSKIAADTFTAVLKLEARLLGSL